MRSSSRLTTVLCFSVALIGTFGLSPSGWCRGEDPAEATEVEGPAEKEYRDEYDRDATNQKKQTWDQYWSWVKSFHEGTFFVSGWTNRAKGLVEGVKAGPERKKLVKEVNEFGRDLCKEWAKDSSVCKVSTSDLTRWGKMVEQAKKDDAGDGEALGKTIAEIRKEYQKKVAPAETAETE